jgi:hypothetical protein
MSLIPQRTTHGCDTFVEIIFTKTLFLKDSFGVQANLFIRQKVVIPEGVSCNQDRLYLVYI